MILYYIGMKQFLFLELRIVRQVNAIDNLKEQIRLACDN
jgi:hypothetical protein